MKNLPFLFLVIVLISLSSCNNVNENMISKNIHDSLINSKNDSIKVLNQYLSDSYSIIVINCTSSNKNILLKVGDWFSLKYSVQAQSITKLPFSFSSKTIKPNFTINNCIEIDSSNYGNIMQPVGIPGICDDLKSAEVHIGNYTDYKCITGEIDAKYKQAQGVAYTLEMK